MSDIDKALAFEWVAMNLPASSIKLSYILLNNNASTLEKELINNNIPVKRVHLHTGFLMVITWFRLFLELLVKRPDVIHTHMRYATLLGISAGYLAGIKSKIHTRHYSTSNHMYFPHAVKHDLIINKLSDKVVSISDVVTNTLVEKENLNPEKIVKIPHGFDLSSFEKPNPEAITNLKLKYLANVNGPVIGIISRYIELKGHLYAIRAFKEVLLKFPNAHLLLANAHGPFRHEIQSELAALPPNCYTEIGFEPDIASFYHLLDVFIHIPINKHIEAFGQTYVEALASGIPSVFTLSGIANEFILDRKNAIVVPYKDVKSVQLAIEELIENMALRKNLIQQGKAAVLPFNLKDFIQKLDDLYQHA